MTREVPVTEARAAFSELINRVGYGGERIVITRHGKPLVVLVPAEQATSETTREDPEAVTVLDVASTTADPAATHGIAARQSSDPPVRD